MGPDFYKTANRVVSYVRRFLPAVDRVVGPQLLVVRQCALPFAFTANANHEFFRGQVVVLCQQAHRLQIWLVSFRMGHRQYACSQYCTIKPQTAETVLGIQ